MVSSITPASGIPLEQPVQGVKLLVLGNGPLSVSELCIPEYHVQGGVAQEEPQRVDIPPGLQVARGEVVAETMGAAAADDASPFLQTGDHYLHRVNRHRVPVGGLPELVATRGPDLEVGPERLAGLPVDRDHPVLSALAGDGHLLQAGVEPREPDRGELLQAETGGHKDAEDGLVTQAEVAEAEAGVLLADGQDGAHLIVGIGLHLLVVGAAQFHADGGVSLQILLVQGPVEEGLDHFAVVVDGGRARPPVGWLAALRPAELFGGHVLHEVAYVVTGDQADLGPALGAGVPFEMRQDIGVVDPGSGGQVTPVAETGDQILETGSLRRLLRGSRYHTGRGRIRCCYHGSFLLVRPPKGPRKICLPVPSG